MERGRAQRREEAEFQNTLEGAEIRGGEVCNRVTSAVRILSSSERKINMQIGGGEEEDLDGREGEVPEDLLSKIDSASQKRRRTRRNLNVPVDGYSWLKYGQKKIHHTPNMRNYYRCVHSKDSKCTARKTVDYHPETLNILSAQQFESHNHGFDRPSVAHSHSLNTNLELAHVDAAAPGHMATHADTNRNFHSPEVFDGMVTTEANSSVDQWNEGFPTSRGKLVPGFHENDDGFGAKRCFQSDEMQKSRLDVGNVNSGGVKVEEVDLDETLKVLGNRVTERDSADMDPLSLAWLRKASNDQVSCESTEEGDTPLSSNFSQSSGECLRLGPQIPARVANVSGRKVGVNPVKEREKAAKCDAIMVDIGDRITMSLQSQKQNDSDNENGTQMISVSLTLDINDLVPVLKAIKTVTKRRRNLESQSSGVLNNDS